MKKKFKNESDFRKNVVKFLNSIDDCYAISLEPGQFMHLKGLSDVIFWYKGYGGAIECKTGNNQATDLQVYFQNQVKKKGGGYVCCCRNLKEVRDCLMQLSVIKNLDGLSFRSAKKKMHSSNGNLSRQDYPRIKKS